MIPINWEVFKNWRWWAGLPTVLLIAGLAVVTAAVGWVGVLLGKSSSWLLLKLHWALRDVNDFVHRPRDTPRNWRIMP